MFQGSPGSKVDGRYERAEDDWEKHKRQAAQMADGKLADPAGQRA